jgi:hypothetical protein
MKKKISIIRIVHEKDLSTVSSVHGRIINYLTIYSYSIAFLDDSDMMMMLMMF